jgi:homeobox protein ESX1
MLILVVPVAAIVLVIVSAAEAHDAATDSMLRAAAAALGDSMTVVTREVSAPLDDAAAVDMEREAHATAVAEVRWDDARHLSVHVRVHVDGEARWSDRELGFEAKDAERERGRTVGFALASMLPERAPEPPAPPAPPPPPVEPAPAPVVLPLPREGEIAAPPFVPRGSIDASAVTSVGFGGNAAGIGGSLALRWRVVGDFALRLGADFRTGTVDAAAATSRSYAGSLGLAWRHDLAALRGFAFGARVDVLAMREQLTHFDFDDPAPVAEARWLPGADFLAEFGWRLTQSVGVFVAFGGEVAFGRTDVFLAGVQVTTVPPWRGVGEAGLQARF